MLVPLLVEVLRDGFKLFRRVLEAFVQAADAGVIFAEQVPTGQPGSRAQVQALGHVEEGVHRRPAGGGKGHDRRRPRLEHAAQVKLGRLLRRLFDVTKLCLPWNDELVQPFLQLVAGGGNDVGLRVVGVRVDKAREDDLVVVELVHDH